MREYHFQTVVQVAPHENYTVDVYFDDGKIVRYDAALLLNKPAFNPLKDLRFFLDSCTVLNGTLAWDVNGNYDAFACLDIDPETLYNLPSFTPTAS